MKIVIIRSCLETLTPRATKNAEALASVGHDVTILAWDRENKNPKLERKNGYQARRFKFKVPYGPMVLLYLPIWWCFEFFWLLMKRCDVIHAMDLDTIIPAVIAAKIKGKPVVYELADIYEYMMPLPSILRRMCVYVDKIFMRLADAVIAESKSAIEGLNGIPNDNVIVIYSSPPDFRKMLGAAGGRNDVFIIFFAGILSRHYPLNLDKVATAVRCTEGVKLIIAGYGDQVEEIKEWAYATDKIEFLGRISYTEVLERTMNCDLLFAIHETTSLNVRYTTPNKLFEAMMSGKPVLVTEDTAMADIVGKENCGLVVAPHNVEQIKETIVRLRDNPEFCRELGSNGRRAYEQQYSWEIMKQRLLGLYHKISSRMEAEQEAPRH